MTACHRVQWYPGSDQLFGRCHCGATRIADDPTEIWQWLLAHPDGHRDGVPDPRPATLIGAGA